MRSRRPLRLRAHRHRRPGTRPAPLVERPHAAPGPLPHRKQADAAAALECHVENRGRRRPPSAPDRRRRAGQTHLNGRRPRAAAHVVQRRADRLAKGRGCSCGRSRHAMGQRLLISRNGDARPSSMYGDEYLARPDLLRRRGPAREGARPELSFAYDVEARTASAAVSMSVSTSSGWETMATWFVDVSMVVAPIRLANNRSASGGIV